MSCGLAEPMGQPGAAAVAAPDIAADTTESSQSQGSKAAIRQKVEADLDAKAEAIAHEQVTAEAVRNPSIQTSIGIGIMIHSYSQVTGSQSFH